MHLIGYASAFTQGNGLPCNRQTLFSYQGAMEPSLGSSLTVSRLLRSYSACSKKTGNVLPIGGAAIHPQVSATGAFRRVSVKQWVSLLISTGGSKVVIDGVDV